MNFKKCDKCGSWVNNLKNHRCSLTGNIDNCTKCNNISPFYNHKECNSSWGSTSTTINDRPSINNRTDMDWEPLIMDDPITNYFDHKQRDKYAYLPTSDIYYQFLKEKDPEIIVALEYELQLREEQGCDGWEDVRKEKIVWTNPSVWTSKTIKLPSYEKYKKEYILSPVPVTKPKTLEIDNNSKFKNYSLGDDNDD